MDEEKIIATLTGKPFNGNLWENYGKRRIYFEDASIAQVGGMEWENYNTGNICYASIDGKKISNSEAKRIFEALHTWNFKLWYDLADGKFYSKGELTNGNAADLKSKFVKTAKAAVA